MTKKRRQMKQTDHQHLLGWSVDDGVGFRRELELRPIYGDAEGHMLTMGPTGSGKGVSAAIPQLLTFAGNVIALDTKGELFAVTARYRKEAFGNRIIVLDPFEVLETSQRDSLNPIDLAPLLGGSAYDAATTIASLFVGSEQRTANSNRQLDGFWEDQATQLLVGLIGAAMEQKLDGSCSFPTIRAILKSDDTVYNLAVLLDKDAPSKVFKEEIATFLQTVEVTRSGILSTLTSHFRGIGGDGVEQMLASTSFPLHDFLSGRLKATIYLVIPPERLVAQAKLVRLIFGTLLTALYTRRYIPEEKTLVQIDEAASLGHFEPLRTGITLLRGNGVVLHALFQDIDQVYTNYRDARTIINNCSVLRLLGASNFWQANEMAELFGVSPKTLMNLVDDEQLLLSRGSVRRCRRVNYLTDSLFEGRFDPNPRHTPRHATRPKRSGRGRGLS